MHILLSWLVLTISFWITAAILPGFQVKSFGSAIGVAALFGILNWLLGWLIYVALGIATLGLGFLLAFITRWIVMALLLKLTDSLSSNFKVKSFGTAVIGALLMSGIGTLAEYGLRGFH